ncbi:GNAT family N-acetyltransferase [Pedococcus sp. P5_B7]
MTRLVDPHVRYQAGYLAASDEWARSGEQRDGDGDLAQPAEPGYAGYAFTRAGLADPAEFARFVAQRVAARDEDTPRRSAWTACHFFWVVDDEDGYVGSLALRHELTPFLLREGGHIGYSIRPSARRRGHATAALRLALPVARQDLGLDRVLVTCLESNEGSRRAIESNGGVYEDSRNGTRRYWVPT